MTRSLSWWRKLSFYWRLLRKEPSRAIYAIQGHLNWFLYGEAPMRYLRRMHQCPACFEAGSCVQCGCYFNAIALSSYKCKPFMIHHFGELKPNSTVTHTFQLGKPVAKAEADCSCTGKEINANRLTLTWNVGKFPEQLRILGTKATQKESRVPVTFQDNTTLTITLRADVIDE